MNRVHPTRPTAQPARDADSANPATTRRGFLGRLFGSASAVVGGGLLAGFDRGQRGEMYGPVRPATAALARPLAADATALFGVYADGRIIERQWAIGHVTRGDAGQVVVVLVDGETGGHAELELWDKDGASGEAIATTGRSALLLPGTPAGAAPPHIERIAARLAAVVRRNEASARLRQPLPSRAPTGVA